MGKLDQNFVPYADIDAGLTAFPTMVKLIILFR